MWNVHITMFGAGVSSFLAPCVFPLVPVYVGMIAGETRASPAAVVRACALFVAGFSAVFVILGTFAGRLGSTVPGIDSGLRRVGGLTVVTLGVLMLLGLRGRGPRERRAVTIVRHVGAVRPLVVGVAFGAAWTPCVGPLLGSALVVAATSGGAVHGAGLLGSYSLGVGTPFLLAALLLASYPTALRRAQRISEPLAMISAALLVVFGGLLAIDRYEAFLSPVARHLPGAGAG